MNRKDNKPDETSELDDAELVRYSRQIFLNEVDIAGQQRLRQAKLVLVGAGGLGAMSAPLLAAAGVGELTLVDFDTVDLSNLARQVFYREQDLGQLKVTCLANFIQAQNSRVKIHTVTEKMTQAGFEKLFATADLVLDGTDNFATRHQINRAAHAVKTPLLSAAVTQFSGQLILFDYSPDAPCYACLYGDDSSGDDNVRGNGADENNCAESGVLGSVASMVATMQATEAQKWLLGLPVACQNALLSIDAKRMTLHKASLSKDESCSCCAINSAMHDDESD